MAGFYAQDSKQLQFLSRWCVCEATSIACVRKSFGEAQGCGFMRLPAGVKVDLGVMYNTVNELTQLPKHFLYKVYFINTFQIESILFI